MFEIASEVLDDEEFFQWFKERNYSLLDKSKLLIQVNEAKLLQEVFSGIFQNPEVNPQDFV